MNSISKIWRSMGIVSFWVSLPALWVYLYGTRRTRVLVVCGSQILVVKGWLSSGKWALPGGGLRRQEDSRSGAVRELREETGLVVPPSELQPLFTARHTQYGLRFSYECFVLRYSDAAVLLRSQRFELVDIAWMNRTSLTSRNASQDVLEALSRPVAPPGLN